IGKDEVDLLYKIIDCVILKIVQPAFYCRQIHRLFHYEGIIGDPELDWIDWMQKRRRIAMSLELLDDGCAVFELLARHCRLAHHPIRTLTHWCQGSIGRTDINRCCWSCNYCRLYNPSGDQV